MLLERGWHLAVCVTDLPLQTARRPVIAHVSATHGVAVLSMPALGPVSVRKRAAETIVRLVGHILGDLAQAEGAAERLPLAEAVTRRLRELGARTERGEHGVGFVARVVTGNIWLLLGMLRANRPWRLALRLIRVLAVAFAAGVFALVTSDIWRLAYYLGPLRLVAIGLGSVAAITVTIMVTTGLWERSPHPAAREQVALFNIVTAATVGLGVAALVPGPVRRHARRGAAARAGQTCSAWSSGTRPAWPTSFSLAWLATSIATLGGALGAALESARACARRHTPTSRIRRIERRRRPAVTCGLRTQPSSGSHGCCRRRWPRSRVSASSGPQDPRGYGAGDARAGGRAAAARSARSPRRCPPGRSTGGRRAIAACSSTSYGSGGSPSLAGEGCVQVDRAPGLSAQSGRLQPQARVRVDSQDDLVRLCPCAARGGRPARGVRRRSSRTSVTLCGSALPARRKMGTSAQLQLSISSRSATKVSVAEPLATPGTSAYPWYSGLARSAEGRPAAWRGTPPPSCPACRRR